jgi:hypothetical protein
MGIVDIAKSRDKEQVTKFSSGDSKAFTKAIKVWADVQPGRLPEVDILRASGMSFCCPREFVLNYFNPQISSGFDFKSQMMMGIGTFGHSFLQNEVFGPMGVLKGKWKSYVTPTLVHTMDDCFRPEGSGWEYIEPQVWDRHWRVRGHIDGIISTERMKWYQDNAHLIKKRPEMVKEVFNMPEGPLALLEGKTMGSRVYDRTNVWQDIAPYYLMQATIYQKLSGINLTTFYLVSRDTIDSKTINYVGEEKYWNEAKRAARLAWEGIRDLELPEAGMKCILPKDKRAKECSHSTACFGALDFKSYARRHMDIQRKAGRKFLCLDNWKAEDESTVADYEK